MARREHNGRGATLRAFKASRMMQQFRTALGTRHRRLPGPYLQAALDRLLDKTEILQACAERFGTPQYFFDAPALCRRIDRFMRAFSNHFTRYRAFYAVKSNSFPGICRQVVNSGMGLDVSSGFELAMALDTGCRQIVLSGPGKRDDELGLALDHRERVVLHLDSAGELSRLSDLLRKREDRTPPLRLGLRVQNGRGGGWRKFGIPLKDLASVMARANGIEGVEVCGLQFHTSWNMTPDPQIGMLRDIASCLCNGVPGDCLSRLRFIDIGGGFWPEQGEWLNGEHTRRGKLIRLLDGTFGFGNTHYLTEAESLDTFAGRIAEALSRLPSPLKDLEVWTEPGRWISTPSMHVLLRVVDKKDRDTVITDGGINILGWERPLTEYIPVINLTRPSRREVPVHIYGSLCTPDDVWGHAMFGEGIEVGDLLLIPDQGAYTYSLRQSFIKPRPRVVGYSGRYFQELEKEETFPLQ